MACRATGAVALENLPSKGCRNDLSNMLKKFIEFLTKMTVVDWDLLEEFKSRASENDDFDNRQKNNKNCTFRQFPTIDKNLSVARAKMWKCQFKHHSPERAV